jgi:hypothetical protein
MPSLLRSLLLVIVVPLAVLTAAPVTLADDRTPRADALLAVHDWKTSVAVGNRYLKQQALVAARELLAREGRARDLGPTWKRGDEHWDAAEAAIVDRLMQTVARDWTSLAWVPDQWGALVQESFSDTELATLLRHFETDVGRKQARIIDHSVAFHVAGSYGMSGKLIQGYPGTEAEQKALTYVWDEEDRETRFSIAANENIEGQRFALSDLGTKYQKTLIIKMTGILNARIDQVAARMPVEAATLAALAEPFISGFRAADRGRG